MMLCVHKGEDPAEPSRRRPTAEAFVQVWLCIHSSFRKLVKGKEHILGEPWSHILAMSLEIHAIPDKQLKP